MPVAILVVLPLLAQTNPQPKASNPQVLPTLQDLSGVWSQHPPDSARKFAIYSFTGQIPPMTPWGEGTVQGDKTPRSALWLSRDSTDPVNPTTGKDIGCAPPGVPRIYMHPYPMEIIQWFPAE